MQESWDQGPGWAEDVRNGLSSSPRGGGGGSLYGAERWSEPSRRQSRGEPWQPESLGGAARAAELWDAPQRLRLQGRVPRAPNSSLWNVCAKTELRDQSGRRVQMKSGNRTTSK